MNDSVSAAMEAAAGQMKELGVTEKGQVSSLDMGGEDADMMILKRTKKGFNKAVGFGKGKNKKKGNKQGQGKKGGFKNKKH